MSSTVLVFDPQGTPHDVPYEKMHEALSNGGTPGVRMTGDDGQVHSVPATKINEAYQHGGKLLPLETQKTEHPGFWHAVGSYFASPPGGVTSPYPGMDMEQKQAIAQEAGQQADQRKAAGYSAPYRALAPVAQAVGVNVPGMEQAAKEGDVGGVAGYAAVPAAAAIAPLALKGAGKLASKAGAAVKPAVSSAVRIASDVVDPDITGIVSPRLAHAQRALGRLAKAMDTGGEAPVYRDATIDKLNIPDYAGEAPQSGSAEELRDFWQQRGGGLVDKPVDRATMQGGPKIGQKQDLLRQAEALKQPVHDIIDEAIPPTGQTKAANLLTKSRVEFQLKQGNVDAAQQILDSAKRKSTTPLPVKGEPRIVPSVQNIRENDAMVRDAESRPDRAPKPGSRADKLEDRAYSQEMNWDLERKGWQAESEARREFIARNSTGATKGSLIEKAKRVAGQAVEAPASSDLTEILLKSLDLAKKGKR